MDAAATLADLDGLPADGLTELDELAYALPTVDALNIGLAGTYAALMRSTTREPNAGPRTSGRRRKPSVLVHQVSIDDLEPERVVRPAWAGDVKLSAVKVKRLMDSDVKVIASEDICEAMDVDGKVSQTDYGRCGGMLSGRLGPNKFVVDYSKGLRSKCKRHRCMKRRPFL